MKINSEYSFTKIFSVIIISIALLNGCSKPQPLSCDLINIKSELIAHGKPNLPNTDFIIESVISTMLKQDQVKYLDCQAKIKYQHTIFPETGLVVTYNYQVTPSNRVKQFAFASIKQEKTYQQWLDSLPDIVAYQKSRYGILGVSQMQAIRHKKKGLTHNQTQQLSFGNKLISLAQGKTYSTITIDKEYVTSDSEIFLVTAYFNADKDENSYHNYFISIESGGKIHTAGPFSYQDGSMVQNDKAITFNGINYRNYAESTDYPIYQYESGRLKIIRPAKSDKYYQNKFLYLSPEKLLKQIKADGCLNGDQFYPSDICTAKIPPFPPTIYNYINKL